MSFGAVDRARTGLALAGAALAASAHNTANATTEGFRRVRATGAEAAGGGVEVRLSREPPAPGEVARPPGDGVRDAIDRRSAVVLYRANLAVVRAGDDLLGELIDVLG